MVKMPRPPAAYHKMTALNERLHLIEAWLDCEVSAAYDYRSFIYSEAQWIKDHDKRVNTRIAARDRIDARLDEIEDEREIWHAAHKKAYEKLDMDKILDYACKIRPIVREEMKKESKRRLEETLAAARKKSEKEKNKRKRKRKE